MRIFIAPPFTSCAAVTCPPGLPGTWERSYPKGRTDLEFVGKYSECFAGVRLVIEFKYVSNAAFKKLKTTIEDFRPRAEDTEQITGYVGGIEGGIPGGKGDPACDLLFWESGVSGV